MTSPMKAPALHDQLVLLDGSKRWSVPGWSRVQVTLAANTDTQATPGGGNAVTQLNEATGEVDVQVTMTTAAQWTAYQSLLKMLRRGTKSGPAVFTSAHPEIRARGIKRLYFVSEAAQPYSPKDGYRVGLKFSEKLKDNAAAAGVDATQLVVPTASPVVSGGGGATPTAQGQQVSAAMLASMIAPPAPADGGRANTAMPGYCSASVRVALVKAGVPASMFGGTALQTEANFRKAGWSQTWGPDSMKNLTVGSTVFFANDPSGSGHVGVVTGFDKDGMPLISGNNLVTAKTNPRDARGTVRLDALTTVNSQPTSVWIPGRTAASPRVQGPVLPIVPQGAPSRTPINPPGR